MNVTLAGFLYLTAAVLFILGLKRLSSPATAKDGNRIAALGMLVAVIVTLLDQQVVNYWTIIAGPELAGYTLPERLKWPRNVEAYEDVDTSQKGRPGATLVLRVDGPRAIEVQYQTTQIIERINAHFGYRAVGDVNRPPLAR